MKNSRWKDLSLHLQNKGFSVYSPATKDGECTEPYIVVKKDGSNSTGGYHTNDIYAVMCYVPQQNYSDLEPFVQDVKIAMKEVENMFVPTGFQSPSFYDDLIKAHTVSIQYLNYKARV